MVEPDGEVEDEIFGDVGAVGTRQTGVEQAVRRLFDLGVFIAGSFFFNQMSNHLHHVAHVQIGLVSRNHDVANHVDFAQRDPAKGTFHAGV